MEPFNSWRKTRHDVFITLPQSLRHFDRRRGLPPAASRTRSTLLALTSAQPFQGIDLPAWGRYFEHIATQTKAWFAARRSTTPRILGGASKRALDIVIALTALILLAPVFLLTAVVVKLGMGGPVTFAHLRVGANGRPFRCYKFRSMVSNGDAVLAAHLASSPAAAKEWQETRKLRDDPRVTRLGHFLRRSSLDELPQLFNVLRGDMSCVGPRPIVLAELPRYGQRAKHYLSTRPGLTGMWQVGGRSNTSYRKRVALDTFYVQNWSLWLDIVVLLRTVPAVFSFGKAV